MSVPREDPMADRRIRLAAPLLLATSLLGACGTEAPDEAGEDPAARVTTADLSTDAPALVNAQSVNDHSTTIDDAQAIAAGITAPPKGTREPVVAAAAPDEVNPLAPVPDAGGPDETSAPVAAPDPTPAAGATIEPEPGTALPPPVATGPEASPEPDSASGDGDEQQRDFVSTTTGGFSGHLLEDGTVRLRWKKDSGARGYNVYRESRYYATVFANEFIDTDIVDRDYYYEIEAFDHSQPERFSYIAKGLTVRVRGLGRPDPDARKPDPNLLDGYDLVFADEFDTGSLDRSKWNSSFLWGADLFINSEEQYYVDILRDPDFGFDPFTFEDGKLVINSIRTPDALRAKAKGQPYLSGIITSYDSLRFTYGYVETRARVPYGRGYWPAFWLLNAYYVDDEPEIDIMEFIGDDQDTVYHTYHYYDSNGVLRSTESRPTTGTDWTADFHTYAVDWRPGLIVYYIDGVEVHRVSDPKVSRQDMYLIANTAVGGWWAGAPDATTPFPGRYEIDYIRVYRQTAPYAEGPLSDGESLVEPASQVPGASPGHRPPFELWPEGYPGRP